MLRYRDFVPKMYQPPSVGAFGDISYGSSDSFDAAVQAAGQWIKDHGIRVIQVETVVLTDMARAGSVSSQPIGVAVPFGISAGSPAMFWNQFVRIWYDDEPDQPYR
jgi:hypothetical protein